MLGSAESEMVRLISREVIFAEFQRITIPQRYRQTYRQTDRQTVRQRDNLPWQYRATRSFARLKVQLLLRVAS